MVCLSTQHIKELTNEDFVDKAVLISRGRTVIEFILKTPHKHGMKGVVWRAKDDTGEDVAIKIMPAEEYYLNTLLDEMTEAKKLPSDTFAAIKAFGSFDISGYNLKYNYKAIATEWINGIPLDEFVKESVYTVSNAILIAEKLFNVIAILQKKELCHDDLHPGNILMSSVQNAISNDEEFVLKVIDTGTIKRLSTRQDLLIDLKKKINFLEEAVDADNTELIELRELLHWKTPDDHLRIVESFLHVANALNSNYYKLDFWEKKFADELLKFFQRLGDDDLQCRLDEPNMIINELRSIERSCKLEESAKDYKLSTPFDFISAEMITNDRQFANLFSIECPWLNDCKSLEPIYIYGPRGCGKSSVLRWLSFKTILSDSTRNTKIDLLNEIGIYVSCSVELRSRFWLFSDETIDRLQSAIILFFNLLLLEELLDTIRLMHEKELTQEYDFGLEASNKLGLVQYILERLNIETKSFRLQGQNPFEYLRSSIRRQRWDTWAKIQRNEENNDLPDSALISDICRLLPEYLNFFQDKHVTFLVDDYSNQRIPVHLQRKLNKTISFAKQGTPIFKVSSEYQGVDLEGIQEGREVTELNIGDKYTSLADDTGHKFLSDIMNLRLIAAGYSGNINQILGKSSYSNITHAIADETERFYYHGINCVHQLCSGDVALALDLIKRIFNHGKVFEKTITQVQPNKQHEAIQEFSHREIRQIRNIVPFGPEMYDVVCYLGYIARVIVKNKRSKRKDKQGEPVCMTHLDIRDEAIKNVKRNNHDIWQIYDLLKSRSILISLFTSRSRIEGSIERLQMRKIYFPAFLAPLKRDTPIKIDYDDDFESMLTNPKTFAERTLTKADVDTTQLQLAIEIMYKPLRKKNANQ